METLARIADRVSSRPLEFRDRVHQAFFRRHPESITIFPIHKESVHELMAHGVAWILRRTPATGQLTPEVARVIRQLGRDHRRFDFDPGSFATFGSALIQALREFAPSDPELGAACTAIEGATMLLRDAVLAEDAREIPRKWRGRVVSVERRCRRIAVVRVLTEPALPFRTGQYVPVCSDIQPGIWRYYTLGSVPNPYGQLEFHIKIVEHGVGSPIFAGAREGDMWTIGAPLGGLQLGGNGRDRAETPARDTVIVANTVGIGPAKGLIASQMTEPNPPRIHLFYGAEYPGELHDLWTIWEMAGSAPWLSVYPVTEHAQDAWWVHATEHSTPPRGLHFPEFGKLEEVVPSYGSWFGHDVFLTGPPVWIPGMKQALINRGTDPERIFHNPL